MDFTGLGLFTLFCDLQEMNETDKIKEMAIMAKVDLVFMALG
jgi:hypothetical protein